MTVPREAAAALLPCDVCGADVGARYVDNEGNGWLVWWGKPSASTVQCDAIHIACHGPMCGRDEEGGGRCLRQLEHTFRTVKKYRQFDHHLCMFAGDRAILQMWRMMLDYSWSDRAARRLVEVFARLNKLPTTTRPDLVFGLPASNDKTRRQTVREVASAMGGVDKLLETIGESFDLIDDEEHES